MKEREMFNGLTDSEIAIAKLTAESLTRGYDISLPEELKEGNDIIIRNPRNGIIVILSIRNDKYFAGGALGDIGLALLKREWQEVFSEWGTPFGWFVYEYTNLPRNHDLAVFEVMWMLERNFLSSVIG